MFKSFKYANARNFSKNVLHEFLYFDCVCNKMGLVSNQIFSI